MKVSQAPAFVHKKLAEFGELHDEIEREREQWRKRLEVVSKVVRGQLVENDIVRLDHQGIDYKAAEREFHDLTQRLQAPVGKGSPWQSYLKGRRWIEQLPPDAVLEQVHVAPKDGDTLAGVRSGIARAQDAVDKLQRLPTPSDDIEQRIGEYVASLDTLSLSGIQERETLRVEWGRDSAGWPKEPTPLQLEALLRPDGLVSALMAEVERMARGSAPPSERPARIRALESEIEQLEYIEEALVLAELAAGRPVERRSSASPLAILQARVVTAKPAPAPVEKQSKVRVVA